MTTTIEGKLSLILPAHNEEGNLEQVVGHCIEVLNETIPDWEIVIVDDGSQDATPQIADTLADRDDRIRVVHHPHNRGYGSAWRSGFAAARGEYLMCMDSDGQFDLADIDRLLPYVNHYDIVTGYRMDRKDELYRKVNASIFHLATRLLFGVHVRDIDCAFKVFRADVIHSLELQSPGALINLEIFAKAQQHGATVMEAGVHHYARLSGTPTGAKPAVVLQAMRQILVLRWEMWEQSLGAGRLRAGIAALAGAGVLAGILLFGRRGQH